MDNNNTDPTPNLSSLREGISYRSVYAQQLPSLQGEGQGWGLYP